MKENFTEIVAILDRSGSMDNLVQDTIGGFNSFIEKQKKEDGDCSVSLVLFDDKYEEVYGGVPINEVPELTNDVYFARGMTAMWDAIGKTINSVGERLKNLSEDERPDQVIFMITTDGAENGSQEFTGKQVQAMIEKQKTIFNWNFIFLGANIDTDEVGASMGLSRGMSAKVDATSKGTTSLYSAASAGISKMRMNKSVVLDMATEYSVAMEEN